MTTPKSLQVRYGREREQPSRMTKENKCMPASLLKQMFSCKIFEIFKNTTFYKTAPVAASVVKNVHLSFLEKNSHKLL